jgi:hypothetical protein
MIPGAGRRNYHYLMSGLVLDETWDGNVAEFGAINVTGFRNTYLENCQLHCWRPKLKEIYLTLF